MIACIARAARRGKRDDAGFSLMEVMVGSALMSVVMAIATGGLISMYRTTNLTESAALSQTALTASFTKLDQDVRYAYRVNDGYLTGTSYAVDYVIPDPDNNLLCVQLSLPQAGGSLVRRQWPQSSTPADPAATVSTVATDLVTAAKDAEGRPVNPFRRSRPDDDSNFDRLAIQVTSVVGQAGQTNRARSYDLKFTALNTVGLTTTLTCTK